MKAAPPAVRDAGGVFYDMKTTMIGNVSMRRTSARLQSRARMCAALPLMVAMTLAAMTWQALANDISKPVARFAQDSFPESDRRSVLFRKKNPPDRRNTRP